MNDLYRNKAVLRLIYFIFVSIRNFEAYELMPSQEVCAANAVTRYLGLQACLSSCTFIPEVDPKLLICAIEDDVELATVKPGAQNLYGDLFKLFTWFSPYFFAVLNALFAILFP
jgi:hypothetical protein